MLSKLRLYGGQLALARRHTEQFAADHWHWFERMERLLQPYIHDLNGVRALDLGCGLLQWQTIMLHSRGADATGVDMEHIRADRWPDKYVRILMSNGIERAAKTLYWDFVYRGRYRRALCRNVPFPLNTRGLDLRQHRAERLPFDDNTFDLVASHEVFEHIDDVAGAVAEVKRVLQPGAIAYINIHLFPSISGGHHVAWKYPDTEPSPDVPPWDHLRACKFPEHPSHINKLRERDYRPIFEAAFEILAWETSATEGRALLTPEIKAELSDYPEEELLKKGVLVVARKAVEP